MIEVDTTGNELGILYKVNANHTNKTSLTADSFMLYTLHQSYCKRSMLNTTVKTADGYKIYLSVPF